MLALTFLFAVLLTISVAFFKVFAFNNRKRRKSPFSPLLFLLLLVLILNISLWFMTASNLPPLDVNIPDSAPPLASSPVHYDPAPVITPSAQPDSEKIADLEKEIARLERYAAMLEQKLSTIYVPSQEPLITFNSVGYDGLITPTFSYKYSDGIRIEMVSIVLEPADGYYIECLDVDNNIIETNSDNSGEWHFCIPDSDVIVYIKKID